MCRSLIGPNQFHRLPRPVQILEGHQPAWHTNYLRWSFNPCFIRDEQFSIHQNLQISSKAHFQYGKVCFFRRKYFYQSSLAISCLQNSLTRFIKVIMSREKPENVVSSYLSPKIKMPIRKNMDDNNLSLEIHPDCLTVDHFPVSTVFMPYSLIFKTLMLPLLCSYGGKRCAYWGCSYCPF